MLTGDVYCDLNFMLIGRSSEGCIRAFRAGPSPNNWRLGMICASGQSRVRLSNLHLAL